jgi:hypothetical protein
MNTAIFCPVLAQMIFTIILLFRMAWVRRQALIAGETTYSAIALDASRWPEDALKSANSFGNQFELPVLFYILCLMAYQTAAAGHLMVLLAWGFVASRVVHAYIHSTSNYVPRRAMAFGVGLLIVMAMIGLLLLHLLAAGA